MAKRRLKNQVKAGFFCLCTLSAVFGGYALYRTVYRSAAEKAGNSTEQRFLDIEEILGPEETLRTDIPADMSAYPSWSPLTRYRYVQTSGEDIERMKNEGRSFVVFRGKPEDGDDDRIMPLLNDEAVKAEYPVYTLMREKNEPSVVFYYAGDSILEYSGADQTEVPRLLFAEGFRALRKETE